MFNFYTLLKYLHIYFVCIYAAIHSITIQIGIYLSQTLLRKNTTDPY